MYYSLATAMKKASQILHEAEDRRLYSVFRGKCPLVLSIDSML